MRGAGRLVSRLMRIIFVHFLFRTLGFWPTIVLLVAIAVAVWWRYIYRRP